jgi:hypothetical protein
MVRSIGALVAGVLVMLIVVSSIAWMGDTFFPSPASEPGGTATVREEIERMPPGALLMELAALAVGSFLGAGTAATVSVLHKRGVSLLLALLMIGLVAIKFAVQPYPLAMIVAGLLAPLPFALLGWRVFR